MDENGLYECPACGYRVYTAEDGDPPEECPQCGGRLKNRTVRRKRWLTE
ncbi:MAG TPA: rubrerythrin-like domain-containing protein [Halococcus sp.]|nr:rubrerythrin-like domain-containing protein [Halococcus sp.]